MSEHRFTVDRVTPAPVQATGEFLAGAAERDITPPFGLPMAGYSLEGKISRGVWGRLFARALVVQDANGSRACVCICDLMSGTRPLLEKIAARTAASVGISADRLILAGTHTHNGPAGIYANSLYDTFAQKLGYAGYEPELVDWLAKRIALTIEAAADPLDPATIATGYGTLWKESKNRSIDAFPAAEWGGGTPGALPPVPANSMQRAVDPRVRVLAAFRPAETTPFAVLGFFGCHYHATGLKTHLYTSDAAGSAVRNARAQLEALPGAGRVLVAIGASAAADVHTLRHGLSDFERVGLPLARRVGLALGTEVASVAAGLAANAGTGEVRVAFAEPGHDEAAPGAGSQTELADDWCFGAPVLAGSEESPTLFRKTGVAWEGMPGNDFPPDDPQHPKRQALSFFQDLIQGFLELDPAPVYPLHQLRIGDIVLATVPGEITTVGAFKLERAIADVSGAADVVVVAYAGDYGGYITTESEFRAQHYEGASTLYGRNTRRYLQAFHVALATAAPQPPPIGSVAFDTVVHGPDFSPQSVTFATPDPAPVLKVRRQQNLVTLRWRMNKKTHLVLASEGPLVRLEERSAGQWRPLEHQGRSYDDYWHGIKIRRELNGKVWKATVSIPPHAATRTLRVRVIPRSRFPGAVSEAFSMSP